MDLFRGQLAHLSLSPVNRVPMSAEIGPKVGVRFCRLSGYVRRTLEGLPVARYAISKSQPLKKAVPALGAAAGLSLSLASGASASPTPHNLPAPGAGASHEILLAEEEISDVSSATFMSSTKKVPQHSAPIFSSPGRVRRRWLWRWWV